MPRVMQSETPGFPVVRAVAIAAASAAVAGLCLALSFRIPLSDLDVTLRANGARLLLAAAGGIALTASGALASASGTRRLREALLFSLSVGAASGAALALVARGDALPALVGALAGAAGFAGLLQLVRGRAQTFVLGLLLAAMLATAVLATGAGSTQSAGYGGGVLWLLGDPSRARLGGAALTFAAAVGLCGWAAREVRGLRAADLAAPGRAAPARGRLATGAALLLGLGVGAVGPVAFVGLFAPLAVSTLLGRGSAAGPALVLGAAVGAAGLMAADAVPRALAGGYALPLNVSVGIAAIPAYLLWSRSQARASGARPGRLVSGLELVAIGTGALALAALVAVFSRIVRLFA